LIIMAHLCGAYQTIKQLLISIVGTSLIVFVCHVVRVVLRRNGRFSSFELASLWTRIALSGARLPPTNLDNHSWFLAWQSVSCKYWYGILQFFSYTDCRDDSYRRLLKVSVCQSYGQNTVGAVFSRHGVVPVHNKKLSNRFFWNVGFKIVGEFVVTFGPSLWNSSSGALYTNSS